MPLAQKQSEVSSALEGAEFRPIIDPLGCDDAIVVRGLPLARKRSKLSSALDVTVPLARKRSELSSALDGAEF